MNREKLIATGVDYDEGTERFSGRSEIYEKYLAKFCDSALMEVLERQLAEKDISGAFRTAHDLKGAAGNLSLKAYYDKVCELTELLRHGESETDYSAVFKQTKILYDALIRAAKEDES